MATSKGKQKNLTVLVGYRCNFRCSHCIVAGKEQRELSNQEVSMLRGLLVSFKPEALLFIGGEPTLYIEKINTVLLGGIVAPETVVVITTNGHFASSLSSAISTLKSFSRLDSVQLSYDNFHKKYISLRHVSNLREACETLGLNFAVLISIRSPLDLVLLRELKSVGIADRQIRVQGIHLIGAAAANEIGYEYPSFNESTLARKCESLGNMVYLCGEGFTSCCSYLAFEEQNRNYVHQTIEAHLTSKFYHLVSKYTFGELLEMVGLSREVLLPEHSHLCALCARIFNEIRIKRPELLL